MDAAPSSILESVPNMRTAPNFLTTNAQAHPNPFSPIADLADNALEAGASRLEIDLCSSPDGGLSIMTMTDDGRGMSEVQLLDGPLSLAYTGKAGTHYGMGATTSIPAIAPYALVLSSTGRRRTVGCISSELSVTIGADQTKMPQCSWEDGIGGFRVLEGVSADAPLAAHARHASLRLMTSFGPFRTEEALMGEFERMPLIGTRIILWGVALDDSYCRDRTAADVLNRHARRDAWPHERSLRSFLSILYYVDDVEAPPMQVWLMGRQVEPRNWSSYLYTQGLDKYKPHQFSGDATQIRFGHTVPLVELRDNFRSRSGKKDPNLQAYRGVFYYNRDQDKTRLILPLQSSKVQQPAQNGITSMAVTERRICEWGFGLVGVVIESHLRPAHNKSEYVSQETNVTFQTLRKVVDDKMRTHLRSKVLGAYRRLQSMDDGAGVGATELGAYNSKRATKEADKLAKPKPITLAEGLRVRSPHGVLGRTVSEGRGRYLLQLEDGSVDYRKAFFAHELTATRFDASDVPEGYSAAPVAALVGARAAVLWIDGEDEERSWESGRLVRSVTQLAAQDGWLTIEYDGSDLGCEDFFVALASGARYLAFRADGEMLRQGREFKLLDLELLDLSVEAEEGESDGGDAEAIDAEVVVVEAIDDDDGGDDDENGQGQEAHQQHYQQHEEQAAAGVEADGEQVERTWTAVLSEVVPNPETSSLQEVAAAGTLPAHHNTASVQEVEVAAASALVGQTQAALDGARARQFSQLAVLLARQLREQEELVARLREP